RARVARRGGFVCGHPGDDALRPGDHGSEVAERGRGMGRDRLESRAGIVEPRDPAAASRANDEVFLPVAIQIAPGDAGTELAERVGKQRLPFEIVEMRVDVGVGAELAAYILKEGPGTRDWGPGRGCCALQDLVLATWQ